ncbi:MAG TPA: tetratricopeptide repeat protein [Planctomycetota bacterium]|nr:tetratricopeptide repeat protein [Planctomycetota bacterium]
MGWLSERRKRTCLPAWLCHGGLACTVAVTLAFTPLISSVQGAQDPPPKLLTDEELRAQLLEQVAQAQARQKRLDQIEAARAHLAAKRFAPAAALLKELITVEPTPVLYLDLGQAQAGLQDFGAARISFQRALDLRALPGGEAIVQPAQRGLGWLAYRSDDYVEALRWWEPLLKAGQRDGELLELCGRAYYATQRREAALRCFDAAQLGRPDDRELTRWRIFCAHDIGDAEQADRLARGYLALGTATPANDPATVAAERDIRRIAAQCAAALHRSDEAILQLERLNLEASLVPADWLLLGTLYSDKLDDVRAADCFEAAYPAGGDGAARAKLTADEWLRLGQAQERAGDRTKAAQYYGQVVATAPVFATAALGLARIAQADRHFDAAIAHAHAALKARPDLGDAHLLLAGLYERQNKPEEAAAAYQFAAATPACAAAAYLGLGRIEYLRDHYAAALRYYQQAAPLKPDDRALEKIIVQLQNRLAAETIEAR